MRRALKQRIGRRQLISLEADLLAELRALRHRVPHLAGGLVAGVDGLLIAHDTHDAEPSSLAALTAAALGVAQRLADATGQGEFKESLVRGEHGYVATYAAGTVCVLTVLSYPAVNVGRLNLEGRRSATRIGALLDGTLGPKEVE
ncbi:roadblock/LC7 domain-containing protein [Kitasatospora sp. MAP5-34]|uniref:roadblock/LC7 domain-containing protein n=1 Tax=Kitasatospora sp. MAP5-34 TaxID=3035102 RepID=UPI0024759D4D|nr:roadblock/LC7 domain-containing protein [Kitasatospora sp. MAP5-34]MDH6575285.1 putative regulator of Ras-like GTPase activity (Roadblock/LC7/MglB family) [Kitasatospora sp. MAP5-34]